MLPSIRVEHSSDMEGWLLLVLWSGCLNPLFVQSAANLTTASLANVSEAGGIFSIASSISQRWHWSSRKLDRKNWPGTGQEARDVARVTYLRGANLCLVPPGTAKLTDHK